MPGRSTWTVDDQGTTRDLQVATVTITTRCETGLGHLLEVICSIRLGTEMEIVIAVAGIDVVGTEIIIDGVTLPRQSVKS